MLGEAEKGQNDTQNDQEFNKDPQNYDQMILEENRDLEESLNEHLLDDSEGDDDYEDRSEDDESDTSFFSSIGFLAG